MASLRKANAYSKRKVTPFTRISKKKQKSYIKVVPPQKIVKFSMGDGKANAAGKFPHVLRIISTENVQIRHNALEACRQFVNKQLDKALPGQYLFRVVPYPHHIQRENKMLTGAGADRMQTGMQLSFGKSVGKSAILKPGADIFFTALSNPRAVMIARQIFKQVKPKLPGRTKVLYEFKEP
ncbi:MAG: 50S ribosomal protein L16 [Candidatus Diapherotrites archaeon]